MDTVNPTRPPGAASPQPNVTVIFQQGAIVGHPTAVPLAAGVTLVGRTPGPGGLAFPEDPMQSRTHCALHTHGAVVSCEDRGSHNGTFINGVAVDKAVFADSDVLRIGDTVLVVRLSTAPEGEAQGNRREDVLPRLQGFLATGSAPLDADLVERIVAWSWPHHLEELETVAAELKVNGAHATKMTPQMAPSLPTPSPALPKAGSPAPTPDRERLVALLQAHNGVIAAVAHASGLSRRHLYRLLQRHALDPASFRAE